MCFKKMSERASGLYLYRVKKATSPIKVGAKQNVIFPQRLKTDTKNDGLENVYYRHFGYPC